VALSATPGLARSYVVLAASCRGPFLIALLV